MTNITKRVFLCYDEEEDELKEFEKERREAEKKFQMSQHGSATNGYTSRYGARSNYKSNTSNVMTEKRMKNSKENSAKY